MKNPFLIIIAFTLFSSASFGQNISNYFKDIGKSDLTALSAKFSEDMEVCVNDEQEFMSKAEAIKAITDFLAEKKPISAAELHQGSSKSKNSQYRVGQLKTAKGNFRVFIYLEGDSKDYEIVGILFNPE